MANYYCLMAGVPDITITNAADSGITLDSFREQSEEVLTDADQKLIYYFHLKQDCYNLVALLENPAAELTRLGNFSSEQLVDLITSAETMNYNVHRYPVFMSEFARAYKNNIAQEGFFAKDQLLYNFYQFAAKCPNEVIRQWYALELTLTNILTAFIARKQGWNVGAFIMGNNEVTEMIRMSNARDFDLGLEYDFIPELMKIVETEDPVEKEKNIDAFKWHWLDENISDIFSIEAVFAYYCKMEMMQRWEDLDVETGKETFRQIIENLRSEAKVPDEFKREA